MTIGKQLEYRVGLKQIAKARLFMRTIYPHFVFHYFQFFRTVKLGFEFFLIYLPTSGGSVSEFYERLWIEMNTSIILCVYCRWINILLYPIKYLFVSHKRKVYEIYCFHETRENSSHFILYTLLFCISYIYSRYIDFVMPIRPTDFRFVSFTLFLSLFFFNPLIFHYPQGHILSTI